jgi:hypothetical protein
MFSALGGCGSDDSGGQDFLGTWKFEAGSTSTLTCDNAALNSTSTIDSSFMLSTGVSSDLVEPDENNECEPIRYDVNGQVATLQASQTCSTSATTTGGSRYTVLLNITSSTYTLGMDGTSLTSTGGGTITFSGAITASCTLRSNGTAKKISQ